ncbi:Connector enhancer of kinase suppressor of ras 3 [Nymphon striatum]|nr:Connector enhancer of kinase suppressor of ras 3 [Nymphon striatum]
MPTGCCVPICLYIVKPLRYGHLGMKPLLFYQLPGLDDTVYPYIESFQNNEINGRHLLLITAADLYNLNVTKVGHQELILEAVDLIRQLNYNVKSENLQNLSLKLGCRARSLYNELKQSVKEGRKQERVNTATLTAVSGILSSVKAVIAWLNQNPFDGQDQYVPIRKTILRLSIELASTAQRDQFAENPQDVIRTSALNLAELCDNIVQALNDPLILQPAYIEVVSVKKEQNEELGIQLQSSYSGIHLVGGIKFQSPAHGCRKISEGDEIVQINYQTVVGWKQDKFIKLLREPLSEVYLSLKKRPNHSPYGGQITVSKPNKLPFRKKKSPKRCESTSPSETSSSRQKQRKSRNTDKDDSKSNQFINKQHIREVTNGIEPRPRITLRRRVTVSGASPTVDRPPVRIEELVNNQIKNKDHIQRSISHDPSSIVESLSKDSSPPNLPTIKPVNDGVEDSGNLQQKSSLAPVTIARVSETNCSSQSTVVKLKSPTPVKLKSPTPVVSHSMDDEAVILEGKSILQDDIHNNHSECGVSSDARSTNADTGFVSLSESSGNLNRLAFKYSEIPCGDFKIISKDNSVSDKCSHSRSNPSIDTLSSSSSGSAFRTHNIQTGKMTYQYSFDTSSSSPNTSQNSSTSDSNYKVRKSPLEGQNYEVTVAGGVPFRFSPTNSSKKSPMLRQKPKSKLVANRRISCKDLGQGDCQGWLYRRKLQKSILSPGNWKKRWFVLKNLYLYCYKNISDETAECLICLPGLNVSPAPECKSKKYAFKAFHSGTTFYFATESQQDLSKWMNKMGLAAISYDSSQLITTSGFLKPEANLSIGSKYNDLSMMFYPVACKDGYGFCIGMKRNFYLGNGRLVSMSESISFRLYTDDDILLCPIVTHYMYYSETDDDVEDQTSPETSPKPDSSQPKSYSGSASTSTVPFAGPDYQPYVNMSSIIPNKHKKNEKYSRNSSSEQETMLKTDSTIYSQLSPDQKPKTSPQIMTDILPPENKTIESLHMNMVFPKQRTESTSSISSSVSTLNKPIPAKRNIPIANKSHTYMNIPPTSPSYKMSLQQKRNASSSNMKLNADCASDIRNQTSSSTDSLKSLSQNVGDMIPSQDSGSSQHGSMSCISPPLDTHPYMNLPNIPTPPTILPSHSFAPYHDIVGPPSSYSLPDPQARRNEFFGIQPESKSPVSPTRLPEFKSKFGNKISASSNYLDFSGYDSSSRASSLDRKEIRDISPGLVARLAGSYNRLDKQDILENSPTNTSAVISGKLKRRELSPGRVARITGSFDSLGRNVGKKGSRPHSTSSVSSSSSISSLNKHKLLYQRSLSASHPAVCELSDEEISITNHTGSCENLLQQQCLQFQDSSPKSHSQTKMNHTIGTRRHKSSVKDLAPADIRRYVSVPEGAQEFMNDYETSTSPSKLSTKHVSLVDREHKRLYGSQNGDETNNNCLVPKSATSQQIQELYSKMRRDPNISSSPSKHSSSAGSSPPPQLPYYSMSLSSSEEYVSPIASPGKSLNKPQNMTITNNTCSPRCNLSSTRQIQSNNRCQESYQNSTMMHAQYVQSPGTVLSSQHVPPLGVNPNSKTFFNNVNTCDLAHVGFIQMGHLSSSQCGPLPEPPPKSHVVLPLKVSKIPSVETTDHNNSGKMFQAFEMSLDACNQHDNQCTPPQNFYTSPRFSKKHLRANSPMQEKKFSSKNRKMSSSSQNLNIPNSDSSNTDGKFISAPQVGGAYFSTPTVIKSSENTIPDPRYQVLLPRRRDDIGRSDSCSSLSSLNSSSTSTSSLKYLNDNQPSLTIPLPQVGQGSTDEAPCSPSTPRTPVPSMGISVMIGKKRCSTPNSSDASIKSGHGSVTSDKSMQAQSPDSNDDALAALAVKLLKIKLTLDGTDIHERRRKTMLQPCSNRRQSKRVLELRALERTLKSPSDIIFSSPMLQLGGAGFDSRQRLKHMTSKLLKTYYHRQSLLKTLKIGFSRTLIYFPLILKILTEVHRAQLDRGPYRGFLSFCDGLQLIKYQFNLPRLIYRGKTESRPSRFRFNLQSSYGSLKTMKVCAFLSAEINFLCSYFQEILLFEQRSYLLTYKVLVWTQYYLQSHLQQKEKKIFNIIMQIVITLRVFKIFSKIMYIRMCFFITGFLCQ